MYLQDDTLEYLAIFICGDNNNGAVYRSGPKLIVFFGKNDSYGNGFPSRKKYALQCLRQINNTSDMDACIRKAFNPILYVDDIAILPKLISDFNKHLEFDGWDVVLKGSEITFCKCQTPSIINSLNIEQETEESFLQKSFPKPELTGLNVEPSLLPILDERLNEIINCVGNNAPLSAVIMIGSVLEGLLLGVAISNVSIFINSKSVPIDNLKKKKKPITDWRLSELIDVAYDVKFLERDVYKFSHDLRDFRNYIHPYEQMNKAFMPTKRTADICYHVLLAALSELKEHINCIG